MQDARLALERIQALSPDPALLRAEVALVNARTVVSDAQREYQESLDRAWESPEERQRYAGMLAQAETALQLAQADYDAAVVGQSYDLRRLRIDVDRAALDYEAALAGPDARLAQQVAHLEAQVAERRLVAPFDGVVLSRGCDARRRRGRLRPCPDGGDPAVLELRADLATDQIDELQVGQDVTLVTTGRGAQAFEGTLRQLPLWLGWRRGGDRPQRPHHAGRGCACTDARPTGARHGGARAAARRARLSPAALQTSRGRTFVFVQEPTAPNAASTWSPASRRMRGWRS